MAHNTELSANANAYSREKDPRASAMVMTRRDVLRTLSGAVVVTSAFSWVNASTVGCGSEMMAAILQAVTVFRQIFQATEQIVGQAVVKNPNAQPARPQLNLQLLRDGTNTPARDVDSGAVDVLTLHPVIPPNGVFQIQWRGLACSTAGLYFVSGQLAEPEHHARGDTRESNTFKIEVTSV